MSAPAGKDQTATAVNGVTPAPAPVDLYRDTPVRYLGYANEVGEAFRPLINVRLVHATYGVAILYAMADSWDKVAPLPFSPLQAPGGDSGGKSP